MSEDTPPRRARPRWAIALIALGAMLLLTSGLCTVVGLQSMGGYLGLGLAYALIGAPLVLASVGLIALGLRVRSADAGPAPLWHRIVGGLHIALSILLAIAVLVSAGQVFGVGLKNHVPLGDLLVQLLAGLAMPFVIAGLFAWLGIVLIRPRR